MMRAMNRRTFTRAMAAGVTAAAVPGWAAAQSKKLTIGITTLIWGALPRNPENLEPALKDSAELGYHSFETFASIVEDWDKKGTLEALLAKHPIPLNGPRTNYNFADHRAHFVEALNEY